MVEAQLRYLFEPVTRIRGVGGAVAKSLSNLLPAATQLSISSLPIIRDLLFHLPISVIDRRASYPLAEAPHGAVTTCVVKVDAHLPPMRKRFGRAPYKVVCSNETGELTLVFFNARNEYIKQVLPLGSQRVVSGVLERFDYQLQMSHPDIIAPVSRLAEIQQIEPVYPLTAGMTSKRLGKLVDQALAQCPDLPEWIDPEILKKNNWPGFKQALQRAHHPQSADDLSPQCPARARLAYDEMLATQLHLALVRSAMQRQSAVVIRGHDALCTRMMSQLPFALTKGQQQVLSEIAADMSSGHRMTRLLQGDVGSGKTMVALLAMLKVVEEGRQSALMAPTELLAKQHYENIAAYCRLLSAEKTESFVVFLTGSIKGAERKKALAAMASGEAKIIIGTHALFQEQVLFKNLSLIVVDEQHRFGVAQRLALAEKGDKPHLLHMTATPIPRSLALTFYGDMDISELKEKPAGRQPITTRLIPSARVNDVLQRLENALERGEKAYWICPMIDDDKADAADDDLAAAKLRFKEFSARFKHGVGLVHGRMKHDERNFQMQQFAEGKTRLLVATTVVEVGVDVRDATIMVIERADRFGLAQLHQLRGRVGRGDKPSACVLLYAEGKQDQDENNMTERLGVLRESDDGFKIAEADLRQRGSGEIMGFRQSGQQRFALFDLLHHHEMVAQARQDAARRITTELTHENKLLLALFCFQGVSQPNRPDIFLSDPPASTPIRGSA
jgi:ATP-dependent DNA helicase RecG